MLSERVVIETVGNNMLQRYSHQRLEDKAKALDTLAPAFDFLAMVEAAEHAPVRPLCLPF
jgi:hypothetical protein